MDLVPRIINDSCTRYGNRPALRVQRDGQWVRWSYGEMQSQIRHLTGQLYGMGLRAGDRVAIHSPNRPEWTLFCLALYRMRVLPVPIFATSSKEQVLGILKDSGARMVAAGGEQPLKLAPVVIEELGMEYLSLEYEGGIESPYPTIDSLLAREPLRDAELQVDAELNGAEPSDTAVLIYTSGTTGQPKGVMLSHANFVHQYAALAQRFTYGKQDRNLCFLPLSHVYEHSWTLYVLTRGAENVYVEDIRQVAEALKTVRPTSFVSVPRLYEKIKNAIEEKVAVAPRIRQKLFHWATGTGREYHLLRLAGKPASTLLGLKYKLSDRLVLHKLREALGGDKNLLSAGGAALSQEVMEFFLSAGLEIHQGYGMTETSPMITCNSPGQNRPGSVGKVVADCEVTLDPESSEILVRGGNVFQGYWKNPEATERMFKDGWLRTGDVGKLDEDGYLRITDRIKDLIITSQGKNIAPQRIEAVLSRDSYIEQVAAVGDGRKCVTALIVPVFEKLEAYAREHGLNFECRDSLLSLPEIIELIRSRVEEQSRELARYEAVKRFTLLPEMFSEAAGTMTPTLKLRRQQIHERYEELIDSMYHALDEAVSRISGELGMQT